MRVVLLLSILSMLSFSMPETYNLLTSSEGEALNTANLRCREKGNLTVNGTIITITDLKIKNVGFAPTSVSYVGYYLSADENFTTDDIYLGQDYVKGLEQNETSTEDFMVDVASMDIPQGEYFVGAIIDHLGSIEEYDEEDNNDCYWTSPKVVIGGEPDLACEGTGEITVEGTYLHISWAKVKNIGAAPAGASHTGFYLSTNNIFTTGDIFLGEVAVSALEPGASEMMPIFEIDVDTLDLPAGSYFIGYIIDYKNEVAESNEENNKNCSYQEKIKIDEIPAGEPNLACKNRGELTFDEGTLKLLIQGTEVQNFGEATASAFNVTYVLSNDLTFNADDIELVSKSISAIAPSIALTLPTTEVDLSTYNLASDIYYVGILIDSEGDVAESNEADNDDCFWENPKIKIPDNRKPNLTCKDKGELIINNNTLDVYIGWTAFQNTGDATAAASQVGFYLSTDQNFTTDDILLTTFDLGKLAPGETQMIADAIETNAGNLGLAPGLYYVGAIVDHKQMVAESNENDNVGCSWEEPRVYIPENRKPNLTCKDKGELIINNNTLDVYIGWTKIENNGEAISGEHRVGFYLSTDDNFTTDDILIASRRIGSLQPGEFKMITDAIETNVSGLGLAPGTYHVGIIIDDKKEVAESNENDNATCSWQEPKVYIPDNGKPNLTCKERGQLSVSGTNVSISGLKITNTGDGKSEATKIGIYLSDNQFFSTGDFLLGAIELPKLEPGQVFTTSISKDAASLGLPAGDYFVGVIVDYTNLIVETNEDDNNSCSWNSPKVHIEAAKPNLTCASAGELVIDGSRLTFSWIKVRNNGEARAGTSEIGYYISTDRNITADDKLLGSKTISALEPNQMITVGDFTKDIAELGLADGTYYVGFIIDYNNQVEESNEADNNDCSYDNKIIISNAKPNLVCASRGEIVIDGTKLDISWVKVMNAGDGKAAASKTGFYLSTDQYFTTSDYFIGSVNTKSLQPDEAHILSDLTVDVSNLNIPAGTYYIGFIIDYQNVVHETNENDNNDCSYSKRVTIPSPKPNLTCHQGGEVSVNGTNVHISWVKVKNNGDGHSNATKVGFYLSNDTYFTTSDYLMGTVSLSALAAGEVKLLNEFSKNVSDMGLPSGDYHIGIIIDPHNNVHETNENDNNDCYFSKKVHIAAPKPNITCHEAGEVTANGTTITISWVKAKNNGGSRAAASKVGYYLSTDLHFTTNDIFMGEGYLGAIEPGEVKMANEFTKNLSNLSLSPGEYYIGYIFDYNNQIHETNENDNNDCYFTHPKVVVHPSKPNLTCKSAGELAVNGSELHHSWGKVMNSGQSKADPFYVGYYLSRDTHFDRNEDVYLGQVYVSSLGANEVASLPAINADVSNANLPSGTYYFGFIIDYKNQVAETNEHDNNDCFFTHPTIHIEAAKPDLTCKSVGEVSINGTNVHISWVKVMNSGASTATASRIGYYLSTDTNFHPNSDYFIGYRNIPSLHAGEVATISEFSQDVSSLGIPSGTYYLGYYIDYQDKVHESNEHNNNDCYWTNKQVQIATGKSNLVVKSGGHFSVSGYTLQFNGIKVRNEGNRSTESNSKLGYYLSTNNNINPSEDILLGTDHLPVLNVGEISIESENINLSGFNLSPGTYYVGLYADNEFHIHESHEGDNTFVYTQRIQITQNTTGKPDLACAHAGQLKKIGSNQIRVEGLRVTNAGNAAAAESYVGFYLSTDTHFDASDYFIGSKQISSLNTNQTATLTYSDYLPNVPDGTYYVGYIIDYNNQVAESNESNNNDCYFTSPTIKVETNSGGGNNACACSSYQVNSFCESFDTYVIGNTIANSSSCWKTKSPNYQLHKDAQIISDPNGKCLNIKNTSTHSSDVILQLGDRKYGSYKVDFKIKLQSGKKGYFGVLNNMSNSAHGSCQVFFDENGVGTLAFEGGYFNFRFPKFGWSDVSIVADMTRDWASLYVNGAYGGSWKVSESMNGASANKQFAGLNFTAMDPNYQFFIDDVKFTTISNDEGNGIESRNEETSALQNISMSYYPNPVSSNLFVDITTPVMVDKAVIEILNPMGQVVAKHEESNVTTINKVFDLSDQPGGMYYIKTQIGDQQIVKPVVVLKQ